MDMINTMTDRMTDHIVAIMTTAISVLMMKPTGK